MNEANIIKALRNDYQTVFAICAATGLSQHKVRAALDAMEEENRVRITMRYVVKTKAKHYTLIE